MSKKNVAENSKKYFSQILIIFSNQTTAIEICLKSGEDQQKTQHQRRTYDKTVR